MILDISLGQIFVLHGSVAVRVGKVRHAGVGDVRGILGDAMVQWMCNPAHIPLSAQIKEAG